MITAKPGQKPTEKELRVLRATFQGRTAKEVAEMLSYSKRTVDGYLAILRIKLGTTNICHTIYKALKLGLLETPNALAKENEHLAKVLNAARWLNFQDGNSVDFDFNEPDKLWNVHLYNQHEINCNDDQLLELVENLKNENQKRNS